MNNNKSKTRNTATKFWDRYIEFIQKQGVKGSTCRWYVKRIEQYIQAHPDQKLLTHTPRTVTRFLENEGRNTQLKDWQFIQTVDAIQKLFIIEKLGDRPQFFHAPEPAIC